MARFNRVILMGNLTRDPELKQIESGVAVADLGLATSDVYRNSNGETVEKSCFVDVVAWGRQAETCARYLTKGAPVFVEGRLQLDQWEAQDGGRRSKLCVRANRIQFLPRTRDGSAPAAAGPQTATAPADNDAGGDQMPF